MEKKFDYSFKKMYPYVETSVLKLKEVNSINNIISAGRLKHLIKFNGYGVCEYDATDCQMMNTNVVMTDKFNRLRTNVIVFDVFNNEWSKGKYDKLFIFKTIWPKETTFNIVFHNTVTGESMHHPEIEFLYDILAQDIMKVFNTLHRSEIMNFLMKKLYVPKSDVDINDTREIKLQPILDRYNNAQWDDQTEHEAVQVHTYIKNNGLYI